DAPAQREIETTLAALEGIDSRSQANYPLITFLKNLLTNTFSQFSMMERLLKLEIISLKQEIRSLRQQIEELKPKPANVPKEAPWQTPLLQYGQIAYVPAGQSRLLAATAHASVAAAVHVPESVGISHEHVGFALEALELSHSYDL